MAVFNRLQSGTFFMRRPVKYISRGKTIKCMPAYFIDATRMHRPGSIRFN
jgi:hypothetical protein